MGNNESIYLEDWAKQRGIERIIEFLEGGDELSVDRKYTLFVTAHLSKPKQVDAEFHCKHFRNKFDRQILGRGKRLYKALFIEEGLNRHSRSFNQRHTHWLFQKPKNLTAMQFAKKFTTLWQEVCGSDDVNIKRITKRKGGHMGLIDYLDKERGLDFGSGSFIEQCSDNTALQLHRNTR